MRIWKHQPHIATLAPALRSWFETELGRRVLEVEQTLLERHLTNSFGYFLLQLSIDSDVNLFRDCRVQRCFKAGPIRPRRDQREKTAFVQSNFEELPFETDSLDVVVAHHVVEFSNDPHAMLRELHRVILPQGRVILVGFNPWSPLGLRMAMGRWKAASVWRNHKLSASRLQDWLQLLGFAVESTHYGFHRLPLQRRTGWPKNGAGWAKHIPGGGIYVITAIKQVAKFIPMRPLRVRPVSVLASLPVAKPSAAVGQRRGLRR